MPPKTRQNNILTETFGEVIAENEKIIFLKPKKKATPKRLPCNATTVYTKGSNVLVGAMQKPTQFGLKAMNTNTVPKRKNLKEQVKPDSNAAKKSENIRRTRNAKKHNESED